MGVLADKIKAMRERSTYSVVASKADYSGIIIDEVVTSENECKALILYHDEISRKARFFEDLTLDIYDNADKIEYFLRKIYKNMICVSLFRDHKSMVLTRRDGYLDIVHY